MALRTMLSAAAKAMSFRSSAQQLAHHDGGGISGGDEGAEEEIGDGRIDVHRRDDLESADGIALVQHRHAAGPEKFVDHQRKSQPGHLPQHLFRDPQAAVQTDDVGIASGVAVGPDHHNAHLHHTGQYRRRGSPYHAQGRRAELAENEDIVKDQVDPHRHQTGFHRQNGLSCLTQRAGIDRRNDKGQQLHQHDIQIVLCMPHCLFQVKAAFALMEEEPDEDIPGKAQHRAEHRQNDKAEQQLHPDRLPDAFPVSLAVKLRRQDPGAGHPAQCAEVEDKDELVHNGDAAHRLRSDLTDHDVVQHGDEVRDNVLDQDRHQNGKYPPIEIPVPYIPLHSN